MSSSTSSFKTELKVLAVAAVIVGGLQVMQYLRRYYFYPEAIQRRQLPVMADQLASQPGTSVVLLGNSFTRHGYDMPLLQERLHAAGREDVHVANIAFDGANPVEWYHDLDRNFLSRDKAPSYVVINISPAPIGIADDDLPAGYRVGWLANDTTWRDVPDVLFSDLRDTDIGGQYLMARVCPLYATRFDFHLEILGHFVSNINTGVKWVNDTPLPPPKPGSVRVVPPPKTYFRLERFVNMAREKKVGVIAVAMPRQALYGLDPGLPVTLSKLNVPLIDCRIVPGLTDNDFETDGWHLNPQGAKIFTDFIAGQFVEVLQPTGSTTSAPQTMPQ